MRRKYVWGGPEVATEIFRPVMLILTVFAYLDSEVVLNSVGIWDIRRGFVRMSKTNILCKCAEFGLATHGFVFAATAVLDGVMNIVIHKYSDYRYRNCDMCFLK